MKKMILAIMVMASFAQAAQAKHKPTNLSICLSGDRAIKVNTYFLMMQIQNNNKDAARELANRIILTYNDTIPACQKVGRNDIVNRLVKFIPFVERAQDYK